MSEWPTRPEIPLAEWQAHTDDAPFPPDARAGDIFRRPGHLPLILDEDGTWRKLVGHEDGWDAGYDAAKKESA